MWYKNVTEKKQWIVCKSVKTHVKPGEAVNVSPTDLNHSGSNVRNFELVIASDFVNKEVKRGRPKPIKKQVNKLPVKQSNPNNDELTKEVIQEEPTERPSESEKIDEIPEEIVENKTKEEEPVNQVPEIEEERVAEISIEEDKEEKENSDTEENVNSSEGVLNN